MLLFFLTFHFEITVDFCATMRYNTIYAFLNFPPMAVCTTNTEEYHSQEIEVIRSTGLHQTSVTSHAYPDVCCETTTIKKRKIPFQVFSELPVNKALPDNG